MNLTKIGWSDFFQEQVDEADQIGRIIKYAQNYFTFITPEGVKTGGTTGKMKLEFIVPRIGDFIVYKPSEDGTYNSITKVLERRTSLSRKEAGSRSDEQVIAANIDYIFLVMSLNEDFNLRRLERYLVGAWESGAEPVVILTKSDLCEQVDDKLNKIEEIAFGVSIYAVSAIEHEGMEQLERFFTEGKTIALVGSSGVGKSTLINTIVGKNVMKTDGLRNDDKGHHTTTHREMVLTDKCLLIDTPGMREFALFDVTSGLTEEFKDIEELSKSCRFSDCRHELEPECAIRKALENGSLDASRLRNYYTLIKEGKRQERKRKIQEKLQSQRIEKLKRKQKPREKNWNSAY